MFSIEIMVINKNQIALHGGVELGWRAGAVQCSGWMDRWMVDPGQLKCNNANDDDDDDDDVPLPAPWHARQCVVCNCRVYSDTLLCCWRFCGCAAVIHIAAHYYKWHKHRPNCY